MSTMSNSLAESKIESHATAGLSQGDVSDFFALMKPRVMFLVVFTALVGMVASIDWLTAANQIRIVIETLEPMDLVIFTEGL